MANKYDSILGEYRQDDSVATAFYVGDKTTDGSWRFIVSGTELKVQRLESSVWVEKSAFQP